MADIDPLLSNFALSYPEEFAAQLTDTEVKEIGRILPTLPPEAAVAVLASVPSRTLALLLEQGCEELGAWIEASSFEVASKLLVRLPSQQSSALVAGLGDQKLRRRLMRLLSFPSHCLGSLVFGAYMRIGADWDLARLWREFQQMDPAVEMPGIVVDEEGHYRGVLDLWRFVTSDSPSRLAIDYIEPAVPLYPEMSFASAAELRQWQSKKWLPVVDHEQRVLGAVSWEQVVEHARAAEAASIDRRDILVDLIAQFFVVMGNLLRRLLTTGGAR